jgi:V/A-type H+/Na+-transporting ATPase subunit I
VAGAEGAVTFYITPAYNSWDPTWIMYFSFAIFFAMIMSDAAYGALMGVFLLVFWKRMGNNDKGRRFRSLLLALVVATIAYGVAIGSYFGICPVALKPFQLQLNGQPLFEQREAMMLALPGDWSRPFGSFQFDYRLAVAGSLVALSSVGWAAVLVGGLVYGLTASGSNQGHHVAGRKLIPFPRSGAKAVSMGGLYAVMGGLIMVFLFASPARCFRPGLELAAAILDGLLALTNISKAFRRYTQLSPIVCTGTCKCPAGVDLQRLGIRCHGSPWAGQSSWRF